MTQEEHKDLIERLGAVHYNHPHLNPSKTYNPRQTILDAIRELTLSQLREQQVAQDVKELSELRASSKTMKALIADLNQKLSGKQETEATIAAGSQMRGVEVTPEG